MATTVEQVVNQALMAAAKTRRIADIYEGSENATVALELFSQTRDELLRAKDWSFSRRIVALSLLKGPPPAGGYTGNWSTIYPYPGFLYEYAYPGDCLDLRAINAPPGLMPDLDPLPAAFRIDNDPVPNVSGSVASGPPAKVILCNVTNALATIRAQVTDPTTWEPGFVSALVESLAAKFAKAFGQIAEAKEETVEAAVKRQAAAGVRG